MLCNHVINPDWLRAFEDFFSPVFIFQASFSDDIVTWWVMLFIVSSVVAWLASKAQLLNNNSQLVEIYREMINFTVYVYWWHTDPTNTIYTEHKVFNGIDVQIGDSVYWSTSAGFPLHFLEMWSLSVMSNSCTLPWGQKMRGSALFYSLKDWKWTR